MTKNGIDRSRVPDAEPLSDFSLLDESKLERGRLANGMNVLLYRYRKLPVVQINCTVRAGACYDSPKTAGLTNMLAEMLDEGTNKRDALGIADAFEYLGTQFNTWSSKDGTGVSMLSLREHFGASLEVFADLLRNPVFPEKEIERVRQNILTGILQEADQPNVVATNVFTKLVYGEEHPYGYSMAGTRESVGNLSVDDIRKKYDTLFKPGNASLIAVGDITLADLMSRLESAFADWKDDIIPPVELPEIPRLSGPSISIVNRPEAVQSQIRMGHAGIGRTHPDYFSVLVMNQILGGQFTSRINLNLREDKGYTYGAASVWDARKYGGHFMTTGGFQGEYTDRAVAEILKEIENIRKEIRPDELETAKDGLIRSLPRQFETPGQVASQLSNVELYGLPDNYFVTFIDNIQRSTLDNVMRAAQRHIHPEEVTVVVVGDVAAIKSRLEQLGIGPVNEVDPTAQKTA